MDAMRDVRGPEIDIGNLIAEDAASFDIIFSVLRFVGITRTARESSNVLSYLVLGYATVFVGLQFVDLTASSDLENRADSGKFFAACLSALTQFVVFHVKSNQIHGFQDLAVQTNKFMLKNYKYFYELENPTKPFEDTQKTIWSSYKRWYVGILVTYLFVFIFSNIPGIGSDLNTVCYERQTNFIWKFFDCHNPVVFFVIFIVQDLLCGTIFLHVLWGFAAFRINVTLIMITQVKFLHNFIEKIGVRKKPLFPVSETEVTEVPDEEYSTTKKANLMPLTRQAIARQLDICIKFHNLIQREQDTLNDIFSAEVLIEFICFTFLICLTIFQAFSERKLFKLFTLGVFLCFGIGYLYSICDMGSALRFQCAHLTKAAYQCKWCTFPPPERRTVIMIIYKAQRTKYLRGGKIFDISVQTFVQLVRMSYSLLLFLFNMQSTNRM